MRAKHIIGHYEWFVEGVVKSRGLPQKTPRNDQLSAFSAYKNYHNKLLESAVHWYFYVTVYSSFLILLFLYSQYSSQYFSRLCAKINEFYLF
jgi:hypothetical protein